LDKTFQMSNATNDIASQILHAEQRLLDAQKNSNIEHLDFLIHDDLLFVAPNHEIATKMMDLEMHRSGNIKVLASHAEEPRIQILTDTATVIVDVHLRVEFFGQHHEGLYRYLRVWKLFGNDWKVIAGSCSQL